MKIYTYDYFLNAIVESRAQNIQETIQNKEDAYEVFEIPKKNGVREIWGLQKNDVGNVLINLQKNLYKNFLKKIVIAIPAKGFVKGECYLSFMQPHVGMHFFMRLDIIDFFGSFSEKSIENGLVEYVIDKKARQEIIELCTVHGKLPQGAITSPVLSNILFVRVDQRILKYCQAIEERIQRQYQNDSQYGLKHICYTRYADDLLFSSNFLNFNKEQYFQSMIVNILKDSGFYINKQKTIISSRQISMNGYVIGKDLHLSRNKLKELKNILYYFRDSASTTYRFDKNKLKNKIEILKGINQISWKSHQPKKQFENIPQLTYYLSGCRSWILSFFQYKTDFSKNIREMQKIVSRVEKLLDELQKLEG